MNGQSASSCVKMALNYHLLFVSKFDIMCLLSGHTKEFHLCVPTEPYVKVSLHTALHVRNHTKIHIYLGNCVFSYGCTNRQCSNSAGFSLYLARR